MNISEIMRLQQQAKIAIKTKEPHLKENLSVKKAKNEKATNASNSNTIDKLFFNKLILGIKSAEKAIHKK